MSVAPANHARVYLRRDGKRVVVVTVHQTKDGALLEAEGPLSLTTWDDEALGESIQTALDHSAWVSRGADLPKSPGAATLKVSGEPSPRAFDAAFIAIQVSGLPDSGYVVQGTPDKDLALTGRLSGQAPSSDFARQVTRIFQICRDRKF